MGLNCSELYVGQRRALAVELITTEPHQNRNAGEGPRDGYFASADRINGCNC